MLNSLENLKKLSPHTNTYGLARSLIALSSLITLLFSSTETLFKPASHIKDVPICSGIGNYGLFCVGNELFDISLLYLKIVAILILLVVVIGYRPRYTCIPHWWIGFSMQNNMMTLDGGDQLVAVLSLFLIPLALSDKRKWHWNKPDKNSDYRANLIGWSAIFVIHIQVAILYLHASFAKLNKAEWIDGTAVYYFLNDSMFGLNETLYNIFNPIIESSLIVIPTWGTIVLQFLIFAALFANVKVKKVMFTIAVFMHEVFAIMLGLISFSTVMLGALIIYLLPAEKTLNFRRKL